DDLRDLGGRERATDVLGLIRDPGDDVDLFAPQLLNHRMDARPSHAHAGTDRIDVVIVRVHRDLRAPAGLARRALHLDDALVDLRHFLLEELDQKSRVRARQHDLRTLAGELDVEDERTDAIALAVALARD